MHSFYDPAAGWSEGDIDVVPLDGEPPGGFDCGRAEQNEYLYERAWRDHCRRLSATRLFFVKGILAGYLTTTADLVELGTREKDPGIRYRSLPAIKIAQLGVDRRFAGCGLGQSLVAYALTFARRECARIGARYVTVDAKPDLEGWYARQGFVRNRVVQKRREEAHPDASGVPISMRFDLLQME
ncbi:MAG TPA: GNAT family N-acetyltransferase [Longimicrobium sp.]